MAGFQTIFWGARGSVPTSGPGYVRYGGNTSCLQVRSDQEPSRTLILDAGSGIRALGEELMKTEGPLRIDLLLTHFHWDHIQGLPYFAPLYRDAVEITVWAHAEPAETERVLAAQMAAPCFPVPLEAARAKLSFRALAHGQSVEIASMDVTPFQLRHPQGATGYAVRHGDSSLVYATDHECGTRDVDEGLEQAASGARHLVIDAQYTAAELSAKRGWGHSSVAQCTALAERAGVGKLTLFHHDPGHDDAFLDRMLAEAQREFAGAAMAREGETLD